MSVTRRWWLKFTSLLLGAGRARHDRQGLFGTRKAARLLPAHPAFGVDPVVHRQEALAAGPGIGGAIR